MSGLPNPSVILAVVLAVGTLTGGAYLKGRLDGTAIEQSREAKADDVVRAARTAAANAAAEAIAAIEVKHVTIRQEVQREILEKPIYRDCQHDAAGLRLINAALGFHGHVPAGDGRVPAPDPAQ